MMGLLKCVVKTRLNIGYEIKESAKQLEGNTYLFYPAWIIDDDERYMGETAMIPYDNTYPKDGPAWLASGDLIVVE